MENMETKKINYYQLNGLTAIYTVRNGVTSFTCVPSERVKDIAEEKLLRVRPKSADYRCQNEYWEVEPLVQVSIVGDKLRREFVAGHSYYDSETAYSLKEFDRKVIEDGARTRIVTYLRNEKGLCARHIVEQAKGQTAVCVWTEIENQGEDVTLNYAPSFSLTGLTPFSPENDGEHLLLHKLRCNWSGEGRKQTVAVSDLAFEDTWSTLGIRTDRIGVLGSMSSCGYHPFIALEDTDSHVVWAVLLEAMGSWQIEAIHRLGSISLVGGQADYLYGHWRKNLRRGETFVTTKAYISAVTGSLTKACASLVDYQNELLQTPPGERELPVIYNEYLHGWGRPTMENILPQLKLAKEFGCNYFVIDAGWFCRVCDETLGDWNVDREKFPNGLKEFSDKCREYGFTACGVWYEFESVTENSEISQKTDWLLKTDGVLINRSGRMFLDFRKTEVTDYLTKKVIEALKENHLNYIKIDYNENIGPGIDGNESIGEGLRLHMQRVVGFFRKLRAEVKDLVMEICSSGGMRHEIGFSTLGSMVSFSDAHETTNGAVIAMDLHRIMQPRTMQIWASFLPEFELDETYFTIIKAMLGRICLSGHPESLPADHREAVKRGIDFYQKLKDVIRDGETTLIDTEAVRSLLHPRGIIRLQRIAKDGKKMLCYAFSFRTEGVASFDVAGYRLSDSFGLEECRQEGETLFVDFKQGKLGAKVAILERS